MTIADLARLEALLDIAHTEIRELRQRLERYERHQTIPAPPAWHNDGEEAASE